MSKDKEGIRYMKKCKDCIHRLKCGQHYRKFIMEVYCKNYEQESEEKPLIKPKDTK